MCLLVWKWFPHLVGVCCTHLEPPNSHIIQKSVCSMFFDFPLYSPISILLYAQGVTHPLLTTSWIWPTQLKWSLPQLCSGIFPPPRGAPLPGPPVIVGLWPPWYIPIWFKAWFFIFCLRDPSHRLRVEIPSNLPHKMLQMVEYEAANDLGIWNFANLTNPLIFHSF